MAIDKKIKKIPLISVIIPAYNCAEYIKKSVDSVLSQDFEDIEIVVINDASTDNTLDILNKNYKDDHRVIIVSHYDNRKLGAARNTGIDVSRGKYLFFLDADDWLRGGAIEHLVSIAEKHGVEMVACGIDKVWPGGRSERYHSEAFTCNGGKEALYHLIDYSIASIAWNKLYLREFIEKNHLRFAPDYYHEDVVFTMSAVYLCQKYISVDESYCRYFQRDVSIVNSKPDVLHLKSYIILYLNMLDFIEQNKIDKDEQGKHISMSLLKAHCSNDIIPKLLKYIDVNGVEKWKKDCEDACYSMIGIKGYAVANFVIELINVESRYKDAKIRSTITTCLKNLIKRYLSFVVYGRLGKSLRKSYRAQRSKDY